MITFTCYAVGSRFHCSTSAARSELHAFVVVVRSFGKSHFGRPSAGYRRVGDDQRLEMRSSNFDVDQRSVGRCWTPSIVWSAVAALCGVASLSGFLSTVQQSTMAEATSPASHAGECECAWHLYVTIGEYYRSLADCLNDDRN